MKKSTLWRTLAQYVSPSWFLSHTANKTVSLPSILQILHRQPNLRKLRKIMMIKNPCQRLRNQNWIPMIYFLNTFIAQRWRSKVVGKFAVGIGVPLSSNSKLDDVHVEKNEDHTRDILSTLNVSRLRSERWRVVLEAAEREFQRRARTRNWIALNLSRKGRLTNPGIKCWYSLNNLMWSPSWE